MVNLASSFLLLDFDSCFFELLACIERDLASLELPAFLPFFFDFPFKDLLKLEIPPSLEFIVNVVGFIGLFVLRSFLDLLRAIIPRGLTSRSFKECLPLLTT